MNAKRLVLALALLVATGLASGCGLGTVNDKEVPQDDPRKRPGGVGVFGPDAFSLGGTKKKSDADETGGGGGGIGVNSFLWRASLDTVSFMPVASADPFGGVIITDWHSPAQAPAERFKLNIYIIGRGLRADGVKVGVFRQVLDGGAWRDAALPDQTAISIEDAILTKARQLRNESTSSK